MADKGIATALNFPLDSAKQAPKQNLRLPDAPRGINIKRASVNIPGLVKSTVRALMVQIAHVETGNDATFNQSDRYGKYAIHKNTLINYGYLSANGNTWLGLEGIDSTNSFLSSVSLQNRLMERFLREQYTACINIGAIQANDGIATVAGMLAVAHQFQDYTYASQSYNLNYVVSVGSNLSVYLGNIINNQDFSNLAFRYYEESNIGNIITELQQDNQLTSNLDLSKRKLSSLTETVNRQSVDTVQLVETALFANISGQTKQRALSTASTSITSLDNKLTSIYTSLPALRAKEWRQTGKINDSLNREGALFFNSGRYAVNTLGAG